MDLALTIMMILPHRVYCWVRQLPKDSRIEAASAEFAMVQPVARVFERAALRNGGCRTISSALGTQDI